MTKWIVMVPQWEEEIEAEDEGDALIQADRSFDFWREAMAERVEEEE